MDCTETIDASKKKKRGQGAEAKRVAKLLKGYKVENSIALPWIHAKFGKSISHKELKSIGLVICKFSNMVLTRCAERDSRVLMKWYDDNWMQIQPYLEKMKIFDENNKEISAGREKKEMAERGLRH